MTDPDTFTEHSEQIAARFLHTALIVDDRALPADPPASADADAGDPPEQGGRGVADLLEPEPQPAPDPEHELNLKALTAAFASRGVLCGALSPESDDSPESIATKLLPPAARADLVILDWVLNGDNGERTKALLKQLLAHDADPLRQRLRAVAIYTGQPTLVDIADELAPILDAAYPDAELRREPDGLEMTKGPVRLVVLAKPDVDGVPEAHRESVETLPDRLNREFATMTRGLVRGVALSGLSALRENTHRILKLLGPALDVAYLGHRAAQLTPGDAEDHLVRLVAAELAAVLADHDIGREADLEAIKLWIVAQRAEHDGFRFGGLVDDKNLTDEQLQTLLAEGVAGLMALDAPELSKKYLDKKLPRQATRVFAATLDAADVADAEFTARMTLRTQYVHPPRALTLGTIVEREGTWLICVQPVCDSIRLADGPVSFPFFPLKVVGPEAEGDLVAPSADGLERLLLKPDPRTLRLLRFTADPDTHTVLAAAAAVDHEFIDDEGAHWRWAAELKPEHAQRVAFRVGQRFARVGLDEPEILRLSRGARRED